MTNAGRVSHLDTVTGRWAALECDLKRDVVALVCALELQTPW